MLAIVIPVFNDADGLRVSLDSICAASKPLGTTTIVIDDGSDCAVELGAGDNAIGLHIVRLQTNQGIENALNKGLEEARRLGAEIIARLDAGDTVAPDRFERQLRVLATSNKVGLVGCGACFVDERGNTLFHYSAPTSDCEIRRRMHINSCILHPTAMFRASLLDRCGVYSNQFPAAEDYELFFRMLDYCEAACIPEPLVTTVRSQGGISVRRRRAQLSSRLRIQLRHFDPWRIESYLGVVLTLVLILVPGRVVQKLKNFVGFSRY